MGLALPAAMLDSDDCHRISLFKAKIFPFFATFRQLSAGEHICLSIRSTSTHPFSLFISAGQAFLSVSLHSDILPSTGSLFAFQTPSGQAFPNSINRSVIPTPLHLY